MIATLFSRLEYYSNIPWLRPFKTLHFNLRMLPFHQAIKLPVFIYGPVKLLGLRGKVLIKTDTITRGMIKIGQQDMFSGATNDSYIFCDKTARLTFNGPCIIRANIILRVSGNGILEFGKYAYIGSSIRIICGSNIYIGDYSRIAHESQIMDSNFHYVYNEAKKVIARREEAIHIGSKNWIGNRTTISKGAKTKNDTIVCSGSLLNKDYIRLEEEKMMLGGTPAKCIASHLARIFSPEVDGQIACWFDNHPEENLYDPGNNFQDTVCDIEQEFQ